ILHSSCLHSSAPPPPFLPPPFLHSSSSIPLASIPPLLTCQVDMPVNSPLALLILDGWGLRDSDDNNAVRLARPAVFERLWASYPHATLQASGEAVGLPAGQMGNSEVGHTNLGAGRTVYQDLTRIDKAIREGELDGNPVLQAALDRCAGDAHALHCIGLLSDGGVHSHQEHLHALVRMAAARGVRRLFVHVITDGRDTSPTGGRGYVATLEAVL